MAQTSWRPGEDMGYHDQGRPGTDLRTASLRLPRTMEKGLGESLSSELAQDRRDVLNVIADAGSTRPVASTSK